MSGALLLAAAPSRQSRCRHPVGVKPFPMDTRNGLCGKPFLRSRPVKSNHSFFFKLSTTQPQSRYLPQSQALRPTKQLPSLTPTTRGEEAPTSTLFSRNGELISRDTFYLGFFLSSTSPLSNALPQKHRGISVTQSPPLYGTMVAQECDRISAAAIFFLS